MCGLDSNQARESDYLSGGLASEVYGHRKLNMAS